MQFPFFHRHLRRTLFALVGAGLLLGGLPACGHHSERWGRAISPEQ